MFGEVLDVADACVQSGRRYLLAVDFDAAVRNVLVPGYGFKQRSLARAVPAEQAVDTRLVNGQGDVFQHGGLPVPLRHLLEFNH